MRAVGVIFLSGVLAAVAMRGTSAAQVGAIVERPQHDVAGAGPSGMDSRSEMRIERVPIPPPIVYQFSRTVGAGRIVKRSEGSPGELVKSYRVRWDDGKPVSKELVDTDRIEPQPVLFLMGRAGYSSSRGSYTRGQVMEMEATAYDPSAGRGRFATFRTATGLRAEYGVVAVDPRVIKLGSRVFVEGYGFAIAADTGGAIKGRKIDLCLPTYREAMRFGRKRVRVHVLR